MKDTTMEEVKRKRKAEETQQYEENLKKIVSEAPYLARYYHVDPTIQAFIRQTAKSGKPLNIGHLFRLQVTSNKALREENRKLKEEIDRLKGQNIVQVDFQGEFQGEF